MEGKESILVGQLFQLQLISQSVQWEVVDQVVRGVAEREFRKRERSRKDRGSQENNDSDNEFMPELEEMGNSNDKAASKQSTTSQKPQLPKPQW